MKPEYKTYINIADSFQPISEAKTVEKLPPGSYQPVYDPNTDQTTFHKLTFNHDELVELPGTAYDNVMKEISVFFDKETVKRFNHVGLLHKMNILLHGVPGTGKTCIVEQVANQVIKRDGLVLFNPDPRSLETFFQILDKLQPETQVLVVYEEIDQLIAKYGEGSFLSILDGEVQKKNAMFIGTTNYYNQIPDRIKRPGRFALRTEVGFPGADARNAYLMSKLKNPEVCKQLTEKTQGFTIDHLKEVVRAGYCMGKSYDSVINSLREEFQIGNEGPAVNIDYSEDEDDDDDYGSSVYKQIVKATAKLQRRR